MKKNKLVANFDFDFALLAIVSQLKEYKMAWYLNSKLDINLVKQHDELFEFLDEIKLYISNYSFETEHHLVRLLINRSLEERTADKRHLIPELKQFDYLLMWQAPDSFREPIQIRNMVREVPGIQLVQLVEVEPLKSKENLIF